MTQIDITYEGITFTATGHYDPGIPADPRNDEPGCGPFFWLHEVWHPTDGTWWHRQLKPPKGKAFEGVTDEDWDRMEQLALQTIQEQA